MARIANFSAWIFGALSVVLKLLKISETVFEVTQKEQYNSSSDNDLENDIYRFTFNDSPAFVPGTTILLMQMTALVIVLLRWQPPASDIQGSGLGEILCSVWLMLYLVPFLKGLFGKGKYGIPLSTIFKSASLTLLFVYLSRVTI
ncbi:hypothetical protein ACFE04_029702 [Oxalis oulophora]